MKTNKKAILGMLVAMVMSLGVMGGINAKSNDVNIQQVGFGAAYASGESEGGLSKGLGYLADLCSSTCSALTMYGLGTLWVSGTTPVGWGYWVCDGIIGL